MWEYRVLTNNGNLALENRREEFVENLNTLGTDGWEVIYVLYPIMVLLKRKVKAPVLATQLK